MPHQDNLDIRDEAIEAAVLDFFEPVNDKESSKIRLMVKHFRDDGDHGIDLLSSVFVTLLEPLLVHIFEKGPGGDEIPAEDYKALASFLIGVSFGVAINQAEVCSNVRPA